MIPVLTFFVVSTAHAVPLLVERFDAEPTGWKERVAVQNGGGPSSKSAVAGGTITLTADTRTKKFVSLGKRVELRGVKWLSVSAKVQLAGVEGADPSSVCGVFVRFDTGDLAATRECRVRADADPHTRMIPVPSAARDAEIGVLLAAPGTLTVDDLVVDVATPELKELVRGRFVYRWLGTDAFREEHLEANDGKLAELTAFFGASAASKLEYWKFPDAATLEAYTGRRADYVASERAVYTILRTDTRALTAALSRAWGDPGALFFEGLAVHLAGDWDGRDPRLTTRQQVAAGTAPALATLLSPATFAAEPPERAYPEAGAFVSWLVASKGVDTVKACFAAVKATATPAANLAAVEAALGAPLSKVEAEFRASL